ncbi:MAG: hypothetical protein GTN40_00670 [Candidatus Aenigmarchaeota archaeon]|nr:hypothetical protein [Candidatus Aenigmarchaeota archaeon]
MKKILILIFFILFSVPCFSQELYQYGVTAEIFENNTVEYKLTLIFVNHQDQSFITPLGSPDNIKVDSVADCKIQPGMLETNIVCTMKASERTDVIITYNSNQKVNKRNNYFLFTDSFKFRGDTEIIPILVKLPEGTGLREPVENSYSPENALIGSDGRRTIINWQMNDFKKGDRIDVFVAFEKIGDVIISEFPIEFFTITIIIIFAGVIVFYQFYWKNKTVKLILPVLKKDEKIIFNTVMKHGNGVNQKIIVKDSGYSKAKVSKVLKSLKERGLIKLERIGRKNKVYIEKKFGKKA